MYKVELTESYFPAQGGDDPAPMTVGDMLRQSTARSPDTMALKELTYEGEIARTWTYAELLGAPGKSACQPSRRRIADCCLCQ